MRRCYTRTQRKDANKSQLSLKKGFDMRFFGRIVIGAAIVLQTGCVTGHRTLDLPATSATAVPGATHGRVYIASVTDDRKFVKTSWDQSVPSVAGDVTQLSAAEKDQLIGRQSNAFGHVMGDVRLPPGDSVTKRVRLLVEQGLMRDGYRVTADPNAPNSVAISVNEFWGWGSMGFWSLTFEAKLLCTVTVNNGDGSSHTVAVRGYGRNPGQFAKDVNWQDAYGPALEDFITNLSREVDKISLRADDQALTSAQRKAGGSSDVYDEIKKLDELRKAGLITDQEFDAQKKKILERQ
jgi:uncharacterized lipoprotein YajG